MKFTRFKTEGRQHEKPDVKRKISSERKEERTRNDEIRRAQERKKNERTEDEKGEAKLDIRDETGHIYRYLPSTLKSYNKKRTCLRKNFKLEHIENKS